jgi:hypothetical protein
MVLAALLLRYGFELVARDEAGVAPQIRRVL